MMNTHFFCIPVDHFYVFEEISIQVLSPFSFWTGVQFSSVAQSCQTLCDPMNHSTPGLPWTGDVYYKTLFFLQCFKNGLSPFLKSDY